MYMATTPQRWVSNDKMYRSVLLKCLLIVSIYFSAFPQVGYSQTTGRPAVADQTKALQAIEQKAEARRIELGIPGIALVIVKDDKIIYDKGLGYKDLEKKLPVTPDTEFAIGSATKAFTALTVLMAQDEGKLSLDDSPKKYLPYFKMYDPDTDKNITIRDLMCHSSGLNRTDLAMITGKLNRAELIEVAGMAKPTAKLREKFQYQNIMFTAAGEIASVVEKQPFDRLIMDRIFKPLGMTNSTVSMKQMQSTKDHSFGYSYNFDTKETTRLPFRDIDEVAPAGSINSSSRDMAKWLRFVLDGGVENGKRLVSEKGYEEWLKPQMKIAGTSSYGLGWFLQQWNGLKVVQHGGNIDGFNSLVAMIPEKRLGFVLLTNVSASSLGSELMPVVWQNLLGIGQAEGPPLPPERSDKLVGKYRPDGANVEVEIKMSGDDLVMAVPGQPEYKLTRTGPRQYKPTALPDGFSVKFSPATGDVTEVELVQPGRTSILKRIGSESAKVSANAGRAAKELIGKYEGPQGGTVEIKETGGNVTFNVGGQQPYVLIDRSKDSFSMSPLPDTYWLTVKRGPNGKISGVVVTQPEGEFEFRLAGEVTRPAISVNELHQKVVDAMGGEANWRKITTRIIDSDIDLENQGVRATNRTWAAASNKTASETTMTALGKTIATGWDYFDGTNGEESYSFAPLEKFSGKRLDDARLNADFYLLLDWKENFKKIEVTGVEKVAGEDAYVVSFEPFKGTPFQEFYSTKTFLLLKRNGIVPSSTSDQSLPYSVVYSDYRKVDGIELPFRSVSSSVSNGNVITTVRSVKQNVPIDEAIFAPRKLPKQ